MTVPRYVGNPYIKMQVFLGKFAKLRKAIISFVISVCLSVRPSVRPSVSLSAHSSAWNYSAPTGRIFVTFDFE